MTAAVRARTAPARHDALLQGAYSLLANSVLTGVLGIAFWVVAARLYSPEQMGRDSALITAMVTLSAVCQLNLPNTLLRFLPAVRRRGSAIGGAYLASGLVALVLATAFVVGVPEISARFSFLREDGGLAAVYVAAVAVWGVFALQDAALTALRRAAWLPVENGVFGVLKLAALPVLLAAGAAEGVFLAWVIPLVLVVPVVNVLLFGRVVSGGAPPHEPAPVARLEGRGLSRFLVQDYAATVFWQATVTSLPILVIALLGTEDNAYFYVPFTLVVAFDLLFLNVTSALVVEGAHAEDRIVVLAHRILRRFALPLLAGVLAMVLAAPLVLAPFGPEYVEHGTGVLQVLAAGSVLRAVTTFHSAVARLCGRGAQILVVAAVFCSLTIGLTLLLAPRLGTTGVAWAWVVASAATGLGVLPWLVHTLCAGEERGRRGRRARRFGVLAGERHP